MKAHSLPASKEEDKNYTTLRLTKMLMYQTLRLSFFGIYLSDEITFNPRLCTSSDELSFTWAGMYSAEEGVHHVRPAEKNDNMYANQVSVLGGLQKKFSLVEFSVDHPPGSGPGVIITLHF